MKWCGCVNMCARLATVFPMFSITFVVNCTRKLHFESCKVELKSIAQLDCDYKHSHAYRIFLRRCQFSQNIKKSTSKLVLYRNFAFVFHQSVEFNLWSVQVLNPWPENVDFLAANHKRCSIKMQLFAIVQITNLEKLLRNCFVFVLRWEKFIS